AAPTLDAPPKPRLDALWSSRTRGNFAATIACEPSLEPLSTTIVSTRSPSAAPSSAARERARCSRVFQETTTAVRSTGCVTAAASGLGIGGGHQHVEGAHDLGHVAAVADEADAVLAAGVLDGAAERVGAPGVLVEERVADDREVRVHPAAQQPHGGADEVLVAL